MDKRFIFTPKKIPPGTIAEYQVNTRESIYFNQDHLFTMLYLIRFSYFDRNIFQAIYSSVSKNETYNRNFFQELEIETFLFLKLHNTPTRGDMFTI